MLKSRVITALILFPLAVYTILFLPTHSFAAVIALVMLIGAYEWAGFAKISSQYAKIAFIVLLASLLYSLWYFDFFYFKKIMNSIAAVFWVVSLFLVFKYPRSAVYWQNNTFIIALIGIILLTLTWYSLVSIHAISQLKFSHSSISGPYLVFSVMMLVWSADTGAYFAGKRFGKNKLAPEISPGKSKEGVYGGLILSVFISLLFVFWHKGDSLDYLSALCITIVTVVFSVVGDLMESMFKRQAGLKDSSHLLPGHGGILDRLDSVTAAGPVFFIAVTLFYQP